MPRGERIARPAEWGIRTHTQTVFQFQEAVMRYHATVRPLPLLLLGVVACGPQPGGKKPAAASGAPAAATTIPITTPSAQARHDYVTRIDPLDRLRVTD